MADSRTNGVDAAHPAQSARVPRTQKLVSGATDFPIVGIGASAGGLEACTRLLDALHDAGGMAFILVQHLHPTHESLLGKLLSGHTGLAVVEAQDGMVVEPGHLYIIPPATLLTLQDGALRVAATPGGHGARLPFDTLLRSMALAIGQRAACIVLSGTGADGSAGLLAIRQQRGLVIAQEPGEAEYAGMPRSAIATGAVQRVLLLAEMPGALAEWEWQMSAGAQPGGAVEVTDRLPEVIDLLRTRTPHDFSLYKPGTLRRRVERRMAMASIPAGEFGRYLAVLKDDPAEMESLARDLLIHVTGFFRDAPVFDILARTVIPELLAEPPADRAIRIWVAGCSTGEEAYSLAMIFHEQLEASGSDRKLQIFASDADPQSVAVARDGFYAAPIAADVEASRLARFFVREEHGYRVAPELRAMVIFTVQDLLTDPPFARIDLVSCRNVMIYLGAEAQRKVVALFHFALRSGGVLLLGHSEGVGSFSDRFEVISKPARLYRQVGRKHPADVDFSQSIAKAQRSVAGPVPPAVPSRQAALAALCQLHALGTHVPAAVLSNRDHECLYSLGPIERYLRMAPGHATLDVLAMVPKDLRPRLRSAIVRCIQDNAPVTVEGGSSVREGSISSFNVEIYPVENDGEDLLLMYFVDQPARPAPETMAQAGGTLPSARLTAHVAALELQLKTTQAELLGAVHSLEVAAQEQKSINDNALATSEEFQSTNEELLTSKEELQSLNEELTALNSQLQETLEQQRTTSADLQNVLYSTDVATLFLDPELRIRLFTPATKALFHIIKTDIGRPLEDLRSLAADSALPEDARTVLRTLTPIEREIETVSGAWCRRILPYRTHDHAVEGVVITFTDISQQRQAARALEAAKGEAERADAAKSRFLAAASHDLRQPLQTLSLLQGLLATRLKGTPAAPLVDKLEDTVASMSGMLNALLDINQIEAGVVRARVVSFRIDDLLDRLRNAFSYDAAAKGLNFRVMPCRLRLESDPALLKQMLRNLVSNALKYTMSGRVLLGCRRRGGMLRIEVWDTGIGIPDQELSAIFDEYHQLDNAARDRDRGLGLGLSIVRRLGVLLNHRVQVESTSGKGSVFSIEVPISPDDEGETVETGAEPQDQAAIAPPAAQEGPAAPQGSGVRLLVVEDDPDLRELLTSSLGDAGYHADAVRDGPAALTMAASIRPDLVITDYNLPGGLDGLAVVTRLREALGEALPVIVLTGDITTDSLKAIAAHRCRHLSKPVKPRDLAQTVRALLPEAARMPITAAGAVAGDAERPAEDREKPLIFIVDDDRNIREVVRSVLADNGLAVQDYTSAEAFLAAYRPGREGCLLIDAYLPGMSGMDLLHHLRAGGDLLPTIVITGSSDVPMVVEAMKAGAADFIEKPIAAPDLLASIARALERWRDSGKLAAWQDSAAGHIGDLTPRQHQIMDLVLAGHPSKNIAADLGISQRTVENHRASIMRTTETRSLPALARLALAAAAAAARKAGAPAGPGPA